MLRFYCFDRHGILPSEIDKLDPMMQIELKAYMEMALERAEKERVQRQNEAYAAHKTRGRKG